MADIVGFTRNSANAISRTVQSHLQRPNRTDLAGAGLPFLGADGSSAAFYVDLQQTGGTDGNKTTACSYTYSAYWPGTVTNPIATGLTPQMRRRNGRALPALIGHGQYEDGEFVLKWCDEVPRTNACTTPS